MFSNASAPPFLRDRSFSPSEPAEAAGPAASALLLLPNGNRLGLKACVERALCELSDEDAQAVAADPVLSKTICRLSPDLDAAHSGGKMGNRSKWGMSAALMGGGLTALRKYLREKERRSVAQNNLMTEFAEKFSRLTEEDFLAHAGSLAVSPGFLAYLFALAKDSKIVRLGENGARSLDFFIRDVLPQLAAFCVRGLPGLADAVDLLANQVDRLSSRLEQRCVQMPLACGHVLLRAAAPNASVANPLEVTPRDENWRVEALIASASAQPHRPGQLGHRTVDASVQAIVAPSMPVDALEKPPSSSNLNVRMLEKRPALEERMPTRERSRSPQRVWPKSSQSDRDPVASRSGQCFVATRAPQNRATGAWPHGRGATIRPSPGHAAASPQAGVSMFPAIKREIEIIVIDDSSSDGEEFSLAPAPGFAKWRLDRSICEAQPDASDMEIGGYTVRVSPRVARLLLQNTINDVQGQQQVATTLNGVSWRGSMICLRQIIRSAR